MNMNKMSKLKKTAQCCLTLGLAAMFLTACTTYITPIDRIIGLCEGKHDEEINLNEGGVKLIIIRKNYHLHYEVLTDAEYVFLQTLLEGEILFVALNKALAIDSTFKLEEKLLSWISERVIIDCYL